MHNNTPRTCFFTYVDILSIKYALLLHDIYFVTCCVVETKILIPRNAKTWKFLNYENSVDFFNLFDYIGFYFDILFIMNHVFWFVALCVHFSCDNVEAKKLLQHDQHFFYCIDNCEHKAIILLIVFINADDSLILFCQSCENKRIQGITD